MPKLKRRKGVGREVNTQEIRWLPLPTTAGVGSIPFPMTDEDHKLIVATLELWKKKLTAQPEYQI